MSQITKEIEGALFFKLPQELCDIVSNFADYKKYWKVGDFCDYFPTQDFHFCAGQIVDIDGQIVRVKDVESEIYSKSYEEYLHIDSPKLQEFFTFTKENELKVVPKIINHYDIYGTVLKYDHHFIYVRWSQNPNVQKLPKLKYLLGFIGPKSFNLYSIFGEDIKLTYTIINPFIVCEYAKNNECSWNDAIKKLYQTN